MLVSQIGVTTTRYLKLERGALPRWSNLGITFHTDVRKFNSTCYNTSWNKRYKIIWALFPLQCICRWYNFSFERCTIHWKSMSNFFFFSGLKTDLTKQEIVGLGVLLKGVQMAVRGMRCVDLCNEAIRILGCYFSYNNRIKEGHNFLRILPNVQSVNSSDFKISLKIGIVVFKSLAILKIICQTLVAPFLTHVIKALRQFRPSFYEVTLILK